MLKVLFQTHYRNMKKAIYWFRKNLRINDNPSLYNAINENDEVICIYIKNYSIYNPSRIDLGNMGSFRKKFLDESVLDLKNNLKKVGIDLYIFDGDLIKIFKEIKSKYLSNIIYASKEVWRDVYPRRNHEVHCTISCCR